MIKKFFLRCWGIWDRIYYTFNRMEFVEKHSNIFRVVIKTYWGPDFPIDHQTVLKKGDRYVKLHIYNLGLAKDVEQLDHPFKLATYLRKTFKQSLTGLAEYYQKLPEEDQVKAILGITILNQGAERLGFKTMEVPYTLWYRFKHHFFKLILVLVHPFGIEHLKAKGNRFCTKYVAMSSAELIRLYSLQQEEHHEKGTHFHRGKGGRGSLQGSTSN